MPFIRTKNNKGNSYRYLVESYRDQGSVKQRTLKYLGLAPKLPNDAPTAVVLFAGGGGVECGMIHAGIRPVKSVEFDPSNPELSQALADNNHLNFKSYGGTVIQQTVQDLAQARFPDIPLKPDYLHASPVCSNFSLTNNGTEQPQDIEAASAVAFAISELQPKCFTLENVPRYHYSQSWNLIKSALEAEGYQIVADILDAANYGVPQFRKRFIAKASKDVVALPAKSQRVGWYEAIKDLIPELPLSDLLPAQHEVIQAKLVNYPRTEALLIERTGFRDGTPQIKEPSEPCWTIKKSIFTDQRGNNRSRFIDLWLADGTVKALTIEAIARIQSFPNWYHLPDKISVAGSLLGYSVPPLLVQKLLSC